jgi:hypothetical protein
MSKEEARRGTVGSPTPRRLREVVAGMEALV